MKHTFKRQHAEGWHEISIFAGVDRWPLHAEFSVNSSSRYHAVTELERAVSDYGRNSGGATAIILAYLTNRPDLEAICETLLKRHTKNVDKLACTQCCVDYVRNHPLGRPADVTS